MRHSKLPARAKEFERQNFSLGSTERNPKEDIMKRNLIGVLSLVVLSLLLNATGAYGQSEVRANVPFAFKVGKAQLPSGSYRITSNTEDKTITISTRNAGAMSLVQSERPGNGNPRLVFNHVGGQYFLREIWGAAGDSGMTLPTSNLEKELQIAAGRSNGEKIVVALK
jgi:hypothetical protein